MPLLRGVEEAAVVVSDEPVVKLIAGGDRVLLAVDSLQHLYHSLILRELLSSRSHHPPFRSIIQKEIALSNQWDFTAQALIASGVPPEGVAHPLSRLEELLRRFSVTPPPTQPYALAQSLFIYLWQTQPHRYQPGGEFRLHRVIENQLRPLAGPVGNCLGLTLLFNSLGEGLGLRMGTVYLEEAFGHGPHTLSLLYLPTGTVDVENILPSGFDYPGHRDNPPGEAWGEGELVAEAYTAVGNQLLDAGDLLGAVKQYDQALSLFPSFPKALINRAIALGKIERA